MAAAQVAPEVASQPPPEPAAGLPGLAVPRIVVEYPSQPPPGQAPAVGREFPELALVKVLMYLYLAAAWVASAALPGAALALRGEASAVVDAFFRVVVGALLFDAAVLVVLSMLLLRALLEVGFRQSAGDMAKQGMEMLGALTWKVMLRDATVLGFLALLVCLFPILIAGLVIMGLLPVEESQRVWIAYGLLDAGTVGCMAVSCFIILPSLALKIWRI